MSIYETVQDFPADVCMNGCRLTPRNKVGIVEVVDAYGEAPQLIRGQGWMLELDFLPMTRAEAAVLEAFLLSLRTGSGSFWMGDPFQSLPLGVASGSPVTDGVAVLGSETVYLSGFTASVTGQLKANDKVQIGSHLYSVLQDVDSNGSGNATVSLWPPLRKAYAGGTTFITESARGVFALTQQVVFSRDSIAQHRVQVYAGEVR